MKVGWKKDMKKSSRVSESIKVIYLLAMLLVR